MTELTPAQFADFFRAVHDRELFDWQKRFAKEVLEGEGWPGIIRVPTGCGKTSTLDVAVFELAVQAEKEPVERTAARRICFVIDRRLVVDEVTEHARRLYGAIMSAVQGKRDEPVLRAVAERLASLAADDEEPLRVVRLRGGVYRDDGWAADPLTPTILVSTVDQIGSRLLFRGYGVGRRSRPVHAGLLAFDTRIILDEAHLSTVFAETLDCIRQYQQWAEQPPIPDKRRVSVVRMSATAGEGDRAFELKAEEREDSQLKPRLETNKPAELIVVEVKPITKTMRKEQPPKAREQERNNREAIVRRLVEFARRLGGLDGDGGEQQPTPSRVVGVVVNRVATARRVFERLRERGGEEPERDAILLTGRIRPYDRDLLLERWLPRIKANRAAQPERPLFVVATQTVEVGANLDFDALVTEAAPLDALRQRFGRLHRIPDKPEGRPLARAAILIRSDQAKSSDDPIYGKAIAETWKWLNRRENVTTDGRGKSRRLWVNFGVNFLDPKLPKKPDELRLMLAPQPDSPLLFPAHLDAWVQTNPQPFPDPDIAPFLHGGADAPADVHIVWRADLGKNNRKLWGKIVALMPPRTREALPVPVYEARAWLQRIAEADVADIEGTAAERQPTRQDRARWALRWRGPDDAKVVGPNGGRPGDTIIVPANYGGADDYGWNPELQDAVADVAETCLAQLIASYPENAFRRPKLCIRLHPSLLPDPDERTRKRLRILLATATAAVGAEDQDSWPSVRRLLESLGEHVDNIAHRAALESVLHAPRSLQIERYPRDEGLVVSGPLRVSLPEQQSTAVDLEHEEPQDDGTSLVVAGRPVSLAEHTQGVVDMVATFAARCGLSEPLPAVLSLAARWHDEGKRDRRFQAWLHGSELQALAALASGQPLAKSGRNPKNKDNRFGYPRGARHEFISVCLFEQGSEAKGAIGQLAKLLIGTHHGHGRPFPPVVKDPAPIPVMLEHQGL